MRRHLLAAALIASSVAIVGTAPAYAAPAAPTLSNLSTSVAGHVTGTVTAGPDAESVWVCWSGCHVNTGLTGAGWIPLDPTTHSADFDLPTWGFNEATVTSVACATAPASGSNCATGDYSPTVESAPLTPTDVVPAVTWPTDTTIGHNSDGTNQQVSATVDDTAGGGNLSVDWDYTNPETGDWDLLTPVGHSGTTQLNLGDGVGHFRIFRCSEYNAVHCIYYPELDSAETTVARRAMSTYLNPSTITGSSSDSLAPITTDEHGTFQVDWHVSADGQEVAGSTGSASGTLAADGTTQITIPGAGLPDGELTVDGTISVDDPDFGPFTAAISGPITVDRTGPAIEGVNLSRSEIHPLAIDALAAYRSTTIKVYDDTQLDYNDKIEIRNAAGTRVRLLEPSIASGTEESAVWNGRNEDGAVVAGGTYTAASVDPHGNRSVFERAIKVSSTRGVLKTFQKTVTPASSKLFSYVGRCSSLKSPSSHGWSGSFGYYANSRCKSTSGSDDEVSSVHTLRVPTAVRYRDLRIDTYGGASRGWISVGVISYWNAADGRWNASRAVSGSVGLHTGSTVALAPAIDNEQNVAWGFGTSNSHHYDVKTFTVVARYYVWQ